MPGRLLGMDDLTADAADILAADLFQKCLHEADCMLYATRVSTRLYRASLKGGLPAPEAWK